MQRLLPLRIETKPLVHPVSLSVTMTRRSPPMEGLWEDSPWTPQMAQISHIHQWTLYAIHLWYFFMTTKGSRVRSSKVATDVDTSGRNQAGNIFEFSPGSVARSQPGLGTRHVPSLTHSSPTVPEDGNHIDADHHLRRQFTVKTTRCLNITMAWLLTGNRCLIPPADWTDGNDTIPPAFCRECEDHA